MPEYSVNRNPQPTGEHEVHADRCPAWPVDNISLGWHHDCHSAGRDARIYFADVDGSGRRCAGSRCPRPSGP